MSQFFSLAYSHASFVYPLKGAGASQLNEAKVSSQGFIADRFLGLIERRGDRYEFMTQRNLREPDRSLLASISVRLPKEGKKWLAELASPKVDSAKLKRGDDATDPVTCRHGSSSMQARLVTGGDSVGFLQRLFGHDRYQLAVLPEDGVAQAQSEGRTRQFTDSGAVHVVFRSEAQALWSAMGQDGDVPYEWVIRTFRPNLYLEDTKPFLGVSCCGVYEDGQLHTHYDIHLPAGPEENGVVLSFYEWAPRCSQLLVGYDGEPDLDKGEPLRTLSQVAPWRNDEGAPTFGAYYKIDDVGDGIVRSGYAGIHL